jgi:hypothetical protein
VTSYDSPRGLAIFLALIILWSAITLGSSFRISFADGDEADQEENEEYAEDSDYYGEDGDGSEYADQSYEEESTSEESSYPETRYDDAVLIEEEEIVTLNVLVNDRALIGWEKLLKVESVSEASFGELALNHDSTVTYIPFQVALPDGYERQETFRYTASIDGSSYYNGTVTIWVRQTNDVPVAFPAEYEVSEDGEITFALEAYDEDNDSLTFVIFSYATFGQIVVDQWTGIVSYTPASGFSGQDTLTYMVNDGLSSSEVVTVRINILESGGESQVFDDQGDNSTEDVPSNSTGDNAQPIASSGPDTIVLEGDQVTLNGTGSYDEDGDAITYLWSQETGPSALLDNSTSATPTFTAPEVEITTTVSFRLTVDDGHLASDPSTITITVAAVPEVRIDVVPGAYPNNIILSEPDAEIPVAIIGDEYVNATLVDEDRLRFGPNLAEALSFEITDFNDDGIADLVSNYRTGDLGLEMGDNAACLQGSIELDSGMETPFTVCQKVKVKD